MFIRAKVSFHFFIAFTNNELHGVSSRCRSDVFVSAFCTSIGLICIYSHLLLLLRTRNLFQATSGDAGPTADPSKTYN